MYADMGEAGLLEVKQVWAESLAGLTMDEIKAGVDRLTTRAFPPNISEFLMLCRPAPDYQHVFAEAAMGVFKTEAAFHAAKRFDISVLRTQTWEKAGRRWIQLLDEAITEYGRRPRNEPPSLTMEPLVPMTPAEAEAARTRLQSALDASPVAKVHPHHWAVTMLEAAKAGQPMLPIQINMACVALGIDPKSITYSGKKATFPEPIEVPEHLRCAYTEARGGRCIYPGSRTSSTSGSERWYCSKHAQAAM
jgi:alkanesulfonate monooxygenase SsuD/methylene tetrahydromethanopterin reductase-like flavin-dependent oxidoreductase (luciferase family)